MSVKPPPLPPSLRPLVAPFLARHVPAPGSLKGNDLAAAQASSGGAPGARSTPNARGGFPGPMPSPGRARPVGLVSGVNGVGGPFTIVAGEAVLILSGNPSRQLLVIANLGTNLAYVQFDNPIASVLGVPLVGGATMILDVKVPTNPISGYSALGTSLYAYEG